VHESQPQYVTSEGVGFGVGALVGNGSAGGGVGEVDDLEGAGGGGVDDVPPLTQVPLTQVPNGMELHGVESDTN
jgi:hypothetical protein